MKNFKLYSEIYDLINFDKDYKKESKFIEKLISKNIEKKSNNSILDLGCGTAKHIEFLYDLGYKVEGIDLSSDMLKIAKKRIKKKKIKLFHSDISSLNLNKKFNIIISLFHVISYQNTNQQIKNTFKTVNKHLKNGGIFIFDFWYGPAVLRDLPTKRVKKVENKKIKCKRTTRPKIHYDLNLVDVNFNFEILNKKNNKISKYMELHKMRYFFDPELHEFSNLFNFKFLNSYEWLSFKKPTYKSWNTVWVLKKEYE